MKVAVIGVLGGYLIKAGDPAGGRNLIEQSRRAALALPNADARAFALRGIMRSLAEAGEIEQELELARESMPKAQQAILVEILDGLADDDHTAGWLDFGGISIKIGTPSLRPKDPARARAVLPKVAAAARASGDVEGAGADAGGHRPPPGPRRRLSRRLATARSIPELRRSDFPGPSDGFFDAVKPVALALIAGWQAKAGDPSAAASTLGEAEALARAITAEDQKLIAQIAIAQKQVACGRQGAARAVVAEAIPLALAQPEPRRSRVLTMLADAQVQAGDADGALRTVDAIRDFPGLEKARALQALMRRHEESGDTAAAEALMRRAVAILEAKAPEKPLPGKVMTFNRLQPRHLHRLRPRADPGARHIPAQAGAPGPPRPRGEVEAAIREAKAGPPEGRDFALSQLVGSLARNGDAGPRHGPRRVDPVPRRPMQAVVGSRGPYRSVRRRNDAGRDRSSPCRDRGAAPDARPVAPAGPGACIVAGSASKIATGVRRSPHSEGGDL